MAVSIPGIRTGNETTFYLEQVINRVSLAGSLVLSIIATIPTLFENMLPGLHYNSLSIISLIILVGISLDLFREINNIILSNVYETKFN
jgi:preprotein translocase subunit SecY